MNDITKANKIMTMFGRDESLFGNWHDNQVMWYEDHQGRAYYRQGNYRLALKNFTWIKIHLDEIYDECLDWGYHSFISGSYN
jgi:hypothetical protein